MSWTHVQSAGATSSPITVTATGVGNLVVVTMRCSSSGSFSITDNASNTYTQLGSTQGPSSNGTYLSVFYAVQSSSATSITLHGAGGYVGGAIDEFDPNGATISFDNDSTGTNTGTSTSVTSFNPSSSGELIVAGIVTDGYNTVSAGASYTDGATDNGNPPDAATFNIYRLSGTTSETAPSTLGGSDTWMELAGSFKLSATTYTLTYTAGTGGTISGTSPQTVSAGGSGTTVTAVPNAGYIFSSWSDGVLTASRTDTNVMNNISVTANFTVASTIPLGPYGTRNQRLSIGIYQAVPNNNQSGGYTPGITTGELPDYEQLKFTTLSPGGCGTATFRYSLPFPYRGKEGIKLNARVEIYDTASLIWRGRIQQLKRTDAAGVIIYDITAAGYAASLQDNLFSTSFPAGITVDGAFRQFLNTYPMATLLGNVGGQTWQINNSDFSQIQSVGTVMYSGMKSFSSKNPQWVFGELCKYGDINNNPLYWHVWEGPQGVTNAPGVELIAQPSTSEYLISLQDGAQTSLMQDITRVWNCIVVAFNYTETTNQMVDAADELVLVAYDSVLELGFVRTGIMLCPRVPDNLLDVQQIANTALTKFARPKWIGQSITIPETVPIQSVSSGIVPPWRVKAGRNCQIREYVSGVASETFQDGKVFYIAKTEWDNDKRTLTITPEGGQTLDTMVGRYLADARYT